MSRYRAHQQQGSPDAATVRFACRVIARAKSTGWGEPRAGMLTVRLAAPPVDGKANDLLRQFLGQEFATAPSHVHIERGAHARIKSVRIEAAGRIPRQLAEQTPSGERLKAPKPML